MIKLTPPITFEKHGRTDLATVFKVSNFNTDVDRLEIRAFYRLEADNGKILERGNVLMKAPNSTRFYNDEFQTHEALEEKVSELAGYFGTFEQEILT